MPMFREVENRGIPCHLFGYILDAEESSGFFENQDIYFSALGDGAAELEIPVAPMHYNSMEIVHGGVFAGLLDSAMGMALLTKNKAGVTTSMSIHYLKSAKRGDVLRARATVSAMAARWSIVKPRFLINGRNCWPQDKELFWYRLMILYGLMPRN